MEKAIISLMESLLGRNCTLTVGDGKGFASHESVADALRIRVYFVNGKN